MYTHPAYPPAKIQQGDLGVTIAENPAIAGVGGNMGKPNTYAGIEIENLTSGVYTTQDLLKGNNLACFAMQDLQFGIPGAARKLEDATTPFLKFANKVFKGKMAELSCPQLTEEDYNKSDFEKYPGFKWEQPLQPATPY